MKFIEKAEEMTVEILEVFRYNEAPPYINFIVRVCTNIFNPICDSMCQKMLRS